MKTISRKFQSDRDPYRPVTSLVTFLSVGCLWLLISEILIPRLVLNRSELNFYHLASFLLFIVGGTILLFVLIRAELARSFLSKQSDPEMLLDPLTQLPTKALFQDRLERALVAAQRENQCVAVLIVGIGRLREVYNSLGHRIGDLTLKDIGNRLQSVIRQTDTISRVEEYDFGIFLPKSEREGAIRVINKILKRMEDPLILDDITLEVQLHFGIAIYPTHGDKMEHLLRCAEVARLQARDEGTDFAIYTLRKDQYTTQTLTLMGELRRAIEQNQLYMVYQPKIDLKTTRLAGVEALVRWEHPRHGMIPPDRFIPLAESSGLITPLSDWIINDVLQQCRNWQNEGIGLPVAINLSRRNLHDPNLFNLIERGLRSRNLRHELLELEITESVIMANVTAAIKILSRLSDSGIQLSMDDFGTGYSSLASLKKLPIDMTKIDKSFVMNMMKDKDDEMIVQSTIGLAHNLGIKVVAEGVENLETWDRLSSMGCDYLQGYYISKPLRANQFVEWLDRSPWTIPENGPSAGQSGRA